MVVILKNLIEISISSHNVTAKVMLESSVHPRQFKNSGSDFKCLDVVWTVHAIYSCSYLFTAPAEPRLSSATIYVISHTSFVLYVKWIRRLINGFSFTLNIVVQGHTRPPRLMLFSLMLAVVVRVDDIS